MDGVKILRPSLDDIDKNTVLRGVSEFFGPPSGAANSCSLTPTRRIVARCRGGATAQAVFVLKFVGGEGSR
jgi:hypothetical protein